MIAEPGGWRSAVNGSGARPWFVLRYREGGLMDVAEGRNGLYRRFASKAAADRAADKLNQEAVP